MSFTLPILHFNDVYRVLQQSKSGTISADQFAAKIARIRSEKWKEDSRALDFLHSDDAKTSSRSLHGLTLFSGDVFNPSIESSVTRGEHMVEVMNAMSVDLSLVGNHDLDFGFPHLQKLMQQTNFPWTFTNIVDVKHNDLQRDNEETPQSQKDAQVEGTLRYKVFDVNAPDGSQNIRIGCMGLVERDWIATVPAFPPNFRYRSMVETAKMLSQELRDPTGQHRCDLIIALTHCRLPNDIDLANDLGAVKDAPHDAHGVDLILGGHDHTYYIGNGVDHYDGADWHTSFSGTEKDKACMLVKSGTDFHDLSEIELTVSAPNESTVRRRTIASAKVKRHQTVPSDETLPELKAHIDELMKRVDQATGEPVAFSLTPLNCTMDAVRTREAAVGSFIADILLHSYDAALRDRDDRGELKESRQADQREIDMALICGGSLRGDSSFGPGLVALRDILTIMPFEDAVIVRQLKGKDIIDALENGFAAYPSQEGRFPQVAGIFVEWDSTRPAGKRVVEVRLLEDVHMFHNDGSRRRDDSLMNDSEEQSLKKQSTDAGEVPETYAFERSEEGGYSIEVTKPRIRKGALLNPEQVYRVVTREYMADGHDGYEALTRAQGEDLIDHENGSLMSTQVRKYLLGASLIWRLKVLRESIDEMGTGVVGQTQTLSSKTRKAIERARALSGQQGATEGGEDAMKTPEKGSKHLTVADTDGVNARGGRPSPLHITSAGAEPNSIASTPARQKDASARYSGRKVFVDSSPGSFRDAMHVGSSEHHSSFDAASKRFRSSRGKTNTVSNVPRSAGGPLLAALQGTSDQSLEPSSAPARWLETHGDQSHLVDTSTSDDDMSPEVSFAHPTTASTITGDNDGSAQMWGSSYFSSKAVRKHVEVNAEDGEWLRSAEGSLAIIAPMCDGRIVDRARLSK